MENTVSLKAWNENIEHLRGVESLIQEIRGSVNVGMCGSPQPEYLFCLSYSLENRGAIVEIGTCAGHSLVAMSYAQKLKNGRKVTTIDIAKHPSLDEHIAKADVNEWCEVIVNNSAVVAKAWNKPIELLWIDGDHRYEGAKADIVNWENFVIRNGYIALHDYRNGTGVQQAVYETLLAKPWIWKMVSDRAYGSIVVFKRITDSLENAEPWFDSLTERTRAAVR
ncbi:class I SAM-dependent methyltransferase [bacterium]|nr:class I SAM-dependent methyltransferase [bacterium]